MTLRGFDPGRSCSVYIIMLECMVSGLPGLDNTIRFFARKDIKNATLTNNTHPLLLFNYPMYLSPPLEELYLDIFNTFQ